jgi:predicted PurR-regulated permease PerM
MTPKPQSKFRAAELIVPFMLMGGIIYLMVSASAAFFPLVLSVALAYLINPLVVFFESRGFKRLHVVAGIYIVAGAVAVFALYSLYGLMMREVQLFQDEWPVYLDKIKTLAAGLETRISTNTALPHDMVAGWMSLAGQRVAGFAESVPLLAVRIMPGLTMMMLVPFITFFLLIDGGKMLDAFLDLLPSRHVEMMLHVLSEVDQSLGNYLRGILVEATILFALALVGLTWLNIEYAGVIAVIMGLSSLIPYVGPLVGAVLGGTAAFIQFSAVMPVLQVLGLFVSLRFIDDWLLQPFILERAVKVHPVVIVFSLLAGAEMFGIWGVIFAMPATCVLKVFLNIAIELHRTEFNWKPRPEPTRISIPYI